MLSFQYNSLVFIKKKKFFSLGVFYITQSPAALRSEEYRQLFRLPLEEVSDFGLFMVNDFS